MAWELNLVASRSQNYELFMTSLSVNINKIALIRNARGRNYPDIIKFALDIEKYGGNGITVHPRPDQRHIRWEDCYLLKEKISTELNIEGYPSKQFLKVIKEVRPAQCTLVPDKPEALTSDNGWDTIKNEQFLTDVVSQLKSYGCRVSLFIDPQRAMLEGAKRIGTDRIEFYTGPYADSFHENKEAAIKEYIAGQEICSELGLGINAGHDLNLDNLKYFNKMIFNTVEVSIGHALVTDALYLGLEETIRRYKELLIP